MDLAGQSRSFRRLQMKKKPRKVPRWSSINLVTAGSRLCLWARWRLTECSSVLSTVSTAIQRNTHTAKRTTPHSRRCEHAATLYYAQSRSRHSRHRLAGRDDLMGASENRSDQRALETILEMQRRSQDGSTEGWPGCLATGTQGARRCDWRRVAAKLRCPS